MSQGRAFLESRLVGAILHGKELLEAADAGGVDQTLRDPALKVIYLAAQKTYARGLPVDEVLVALTLSQTPVPGTADTGLDFVGGEKTLKRLHREAKAVATVDQVKELVESLKSAPEPTAEGDKEKPVDPQVEARKQKVADMRADMKARGEPETAFLLDEVRMFVDRYVVLPGDAYRVAVALWILHTHAIEAAYTTPRLVLKSPEKQCGKTRVLELLEVLTPHPLMTVNASISGIFRLLAEEQATLLFDEVDAIFSTQIGGDHEDLRSLINAGHRRGAYVVRCVGDGGSMQVGRFPVFAPTALASIGDLPETIEDRGIVIPMRRRAPDEVVESFRLRTVLREAVEMVEWLRQWATDYTTQLADAVPDVPLDVTDRAADIWEPLLAIADLAGDGWAKQARKAASEIVQGAVADEQSLGVRLLDDIKTAFDVVVVDENGKATVTGQHEKLSSAVLVEKLAAMPEAPWGDLRGKPLDQRGLAHRLRVYRMADGKPILSKNVRLSDGSTPKGYERVQFLDAWARYLRHDERSKTPPPEPPQAPQAPQMPNLNLGFVADVADVADRGGLSENVDSDALRHTEPVEPDPNGLTRRRLRHYTSGWYLEPDGPPRRGRRAATEAHATEEAARAYALAMGLEVVE